MNPFVHTSRGWVNLAHVRRISRLSQKGRPDTWGFYGSDGSHLGDFIGNFDPDVETAPLVPAEPGSRAILVYVWADDGRPTEENIHTEVQPIIAWRVLRFGSEPVLPETTASNAKLLISLPDGKLLVPEEQTFDDLADAKRHFLRKAQADWDRQHTDSSRVERETPAAIVAKVRDEQEPRA